MKLHCQNFFKTISFLWFYKKKHYLILNFGLLFVVVFSSFLLLAIFSSVTRVKGFITQAIWLLIISYHEWKSNTPEWLNYLKPHTNCIFCSPEMPSECWLRKQKFVENSIYLYCIWTFVPVPSNTAGPIWNIWSSHAMGKKSHPYINHNTECHDLEPFLTGVVHNDILPVMMMKYLVLGLCYDNNFYTVQWSMRRLFKYKINWSIFTSINSSLLFTCLKTRDTINDKIWTFFAIDVIGQNEI